MNTFQIRIYIQFYFIDLYNNFQKKTMKMKVIIAIALCIAITQACIIPILKHIHRNKGLNKFNGKSSGDNQSGTSRPPVQVQAPKPQISPRNVLTLALQYACREHIPFHSCTGAVQWNGVTIYEIKPSNYAITPLHLTVSAKVGLNSLKFIGTGTADHLGLTIDNVRLTRNGARSEDIIVNGGFEHPNVKGDWQFFNNIQGWKGREIQLGRGSIYNSGWKSQVCELDTDENTAITQEFTFNNNFELESSGASQPQILLTLALQYACREHIPFHSCTGAVQWNGVTIFEIKPSNYAITPLHLTVSAKVGLNSLKFIGTGTADHLGLTIDNVRLTRNGARSEDIIVNGGFEHPNVKGDWQFFNNIQGWKGREIQLGRGSIYNSGWKSQVCELDTDENTAITQEFTFNNNFELESSGASQPQILLTLALQYACREHIPFHSCTGAVQWNGVTIYEIKPSNYAITPLHLTVSAKVGLNSLKFIGTGTADHLGLTIDNVRLTRNGARSEDIIVNGGFEHPNVKGDWQFFNNIQGWKGREIQLGRGSIYNSGWKSQVCELDTDENTAITQEFTFNNNFELESSGASQPQILLTLALQYACREHIPFHSCTGAVQWNGVTIFEIKPSNYAITPLHLTVSAKVGLNSLKFIGTGTSDYLGLTIDNVRLTRNGARSEDIIVNGGFEHPNVKGDWQYFKNIQGWKGCEIQLGRGSFYNSGWKSQVCELDTDENTAITQEFTFNNNFELVRCH